MSLNLADLTEAVVDAIPDRTALSCGDESRTYAEFDAPRQPGRALPRGRRSDRR